MMASFNSEAVTDSHRLTYVWNHVYETSKVS